MSQPNLRYNLLGQIAVTTAIDFGLANLISTTAEMSDGYNPAAGKTLGILAVILASHVCVNMLSVRALRYMIYTSVSLQSLGIVCLAIAVLAKAPTHQSAKFVFAMYHDGTGIDGQEGWSQRASPAYVAAVGVLFSQYILLGYDASAHLCEETRKAVRDAPMGLLASIIGSAAMGFFLLIALLFSIQDFETVRKSPLPVLTIFTDACGTAGGLVLMVLVMLCVWHCGLFSLVSNIFHPPQRGNATRKKLLLSHICLSLANSSKTSNSRMMFAFARDGGIPHKLHIVDRGFHSPIRTVLFGASCSFLLALPSLGSTVAFNGTTSIATISLYLSYGIPIAMPLVWPRNFKRGPFNLGSASKVVAIIACLWISFITIVFCLPTVNPVTSQSFNYTPVALGIVTIFSFGSWAFWARHWFTGRCRHHCRICIRQLDFLGEEMVYRSDTVGSDGHQRLKSDESQSGTSDFPPSGLNSTKVHKSTSSVKDKYVLSPNFAQIQQYSFMEKRASLGNDRILTFCTARYRSEGSSKYIRRPRGNTKRCKFCNIR